MGSKIDTQSDEAEKADSGFMRKAQQLLVVRAAMTGRVMVVSALLVGCPSPQRNTNLPTLSWSITSTKDDGTVSNIPVEGGATTVDPTATLQVKLLADSPSGISEMTLKGVGNVNCQAPVSAEKDSRNYAAYCPRARSGYTE